MLILVRQFTIDKTLTDEEGDPLTNEEGEPTGETQRELVPVVVAGVADEDVARERAAAETIPTEPLVRQRDDALEQVEAQNRFAVYEPSGDVDGDGFPDSFTFKDVLSTTPSDATAPAASVRKVQRKAP